jgi:hypothetical protein
MIMNLRKPLMIAGVTSGVALGSLAGVGAASAATTSTSTAGPSGLITKIAQKFNLQESDVKAVFEEDRAAHKAERTQKFEEKLTQAVTEGKITPEQKDKILAKAKELQASREANRDAMESKTPEERKAAMEAERTALKQWATDNNIPEQYLRFAFGHRGHGGPGPRDDQ